MWGYTKETDLNKQNKNIAKIFLMLALIGAPASGNAQSKRTPQYWAQEYATFIMRLCDSDAYHDVSRIEKKHAEKRTYADAASMIPELTRDSTMHADAIKKYAEIAIEKPYSYSGPDFIYLTYEVLDTYRDKSADKTSKHYQMGKHMAEYTDVLKQLKLARYTMRLKKNEK